MASARRPTGRDRGQATVEFALALPLLLILVAAVIQVAVVIRDQLAVGVAAREGARAAAVAADPAAAAASAATAAVSLAPLEVSTSTTGGVVTVRVAYANPTDVVMLGRLLGDAVLTAQVTMAREPP